MTVCVLVFVFQRHVVVTLLSVFSTARSGELQESAPDQQRGVRLSDPGAAHRPPPGGSPGPAETPAE